MTWIIDDIIGANRSFMEIAASDPLSAVLLAFGGLLTAFAVVVFGVLSLGAVASLFSSD